jgi:hypothetical protein
MDRNNIFTRIWAVYEDGGLLAMCAWCGRVRLDSEWVFAPRSVLVAIDEPSIISHSICETCVAGFGSIFDGHAYTEIGASQRLASQK